MKVVFDLVEALRSVNVSEDKALKVGQSLDESLKETFVEKLAVDGRFEAVDARFNAVEARFNAVDTRFDVLGQQIDARFKRADERLEAMVALLGEKIKSEIASAVNRLVGYGVAVAGLIVAILKLWPN